MSMDEVVKLLTSGLVGGIICLTVTPRRLTPSIERTYSGLRRPQSAHVRR
jgi:hypothetical protein